MQTPNITLYGFVPYDRSGKIAWALSELGLPFEFKKLDHEKNEHKSAEHLKRHPKGSVPVLEIGDITMFESDAILWFLAERFPNGNLAPDVGTKDRAACLQWLHYCDGTLGYAKMARWPLLDLDVTSDKVAALKKDVEEDFERSLQVLENHLKGRDYLCAAFTVADIALAYSLSWTEKRGDLKNYPALTEYMGKIKTRPGAVKSKVFERE